MTDHEDGRRTRYAHRRKEILAAVTEHVLEHGVAGVTLRSIATGAGVSHATLVHHFETRDALVTEIVESVLRQALVPPVGGEDWLADAWQYLTSPEGLRYARLFTEIVGLSLYDEPAWTASLRGSVQERIHSLADGYLALGCPPEEALATATSTIGRLRGLVVDLLLTGERERVDAAFALLRRDAVRRVAEWAQPPGA